VTVLAAPPLPATVGVTGRSWGPRWGWSLAGLALVTLFVTAWGVGGSLRYVLAGNAGSLGGAGGAGRGGGDDTATSSAEIRAWVLENCTAVTDAAASGIYDCTP